MRQITKIYLHCSASEWGSAEEIRKWHMEGNSWSDIGYHFVICNSFQTYAQWKKRTDAVSNADSNNSNRLYASSTDGIIQTGRPVSIRGAHVKNDNTYSIGICYIGLSPTAAQFNSLLVLCAELMREYPLLKIDNIFGHHDYWLSKGEEPKKSCPNFSMITFREMLRLLTYNV